MEMRLQVEQASNSAELSLIYEQPGGLNYQVPEENSGQLHLPPTSLKSFYGRSKVGQLLSIYT